MASLGQLEERTKKILDDAKKPDTPLPLLGSDGKPIDLGKLQKLLDATAFGKKAMEESHRTLDARLLQSIVALRAKAKPGR
ncbi:MAG: hypothetical protein IPJ19_18770 [Planctomycetes bacterium]|nr:hypothetical protein [Planctomycetota bacterium]